MVSESDGGNVPGRGQRGHGEEASQKSRWSHGEVNINDVTQGLASLITGSIYSDIWFVL